MGERNTAQEAEAETLFKTVYLRAPDRSNPNDDTAVITMAYGLRPEPRNIQSEAEAIGFYNGIFAPHCT